jgi:sporulation protein YlmC with PRC-barrel domain
VGVALLGTAVIGSAAFAQSTQPADRAAPAANAPPAQAKMALKGNWRASKLMGLNVYNEANEKLGDVNELLVDKSGKISAVAASASSVWGEHDIAVSMEKLKFVEEPVRNQL